MGAVAEDRKRLGRPADADSADTRARIVMHAQELFGAEGFEATTNKRIADLAGVSSAALYHYFPSKADIYVAVCDSIVESFDRTFERVCASSPHLADRLRAVVQSNLEMGRSSRAVLGFVASLPMVVRKHPEVRDGIERLSQSFRSMVVSMVETSDDIEDVLRGTGVPAFSDLVVLVLSGMGRLGASGLSERQEGAAEAFLHLVLSGSAS